MGWRRNIRSWLSRPTHNKEGATPPLLDNLDSGVLDIRSSTWLFINGYLKEELVKAREANDSIRRTEIQTAEIRGRIKFIKEIQALPNINDGKKNKKPSDNDDDFY